MISYVLDESVENENKNKILVNFLLLSEVVFCCFCLTLNPCHIQMSLV